MKTMLKLFIALIIVMTVIAGCHPVPVNPGTTPIVTTGNASQITKLSAIVSGTITNNGGHEITEDGFYFSSTNSPTNNSPKTIAVKSTHTFTSYLQSLKFNTVYYYMAYATNSLGTSYGQVKSFTTSDRDATLSIMSDSALTMHSVDIHINITPHASTITEAGLCFSTNRNPTTSDSKVTTNVISGVSTISLTGLVANTHYYIRAYVITSTRTLYSDPNHKIWTYAVMDVDGNGYHAVTIGGQTWTLENYKVTHYRNGDLIPNVKDNKYWSVKLGFGLTTGALCYYDNDSAKYDSVYGPLYNGYAVSDSRGFTPNGWRLPTIGDVYSLGAYLGGNLKGNLSGGKLKEVGTKHWKSPNEGATNSSGFTALPAGSRVDAWQDKGNGIFSDLGLGARWWEQDQFSPTVRWSFFVEYNNIYIAEAVAYDKTYGNSVRLIKDSAIN